MTLDLVVSLIRQGKQKTLLSIPEVLGTTILSHLVFWEKLTTNNMYYCCSIMYYVVIYITAHLCMFPLCSPFTVTHFTSLVM